MRKIVFATEGKKLALKISQLMHTSVKEKGGREGGRLDRMQFRSRGQVLDLLLSHTIWD